MSITMIAPAGTSGIVNGNAANYTVAADGTISNVASTDVLALLRAGFRLFSTFIDRVFISSPLPADLVSIVAAATPVNGALTVVAQPPHARKLQIRVVIGTTTTTAITAGSVALSGNDQDGNAVSETISIIENASATIKSKWAYSGGVAATLSNYAANGSGTGNTLGIGVSNDFGVQTAPGVVDFTLIKATKTTKVLGTSNTTVDDVASTATVDATARTIASTTAPANNGLVDYDFTYSWGAPA